MLRKYKIDDANARAACVEELDAGNIIVVPTMRWYMFLARADRELAADRIFRLKRRPPDKSLLLVCASSNWVESTFVLTNDARRLIQSFWPGDLSMRLRWRATTAGVTAVGVPVGLVSVASGLMGELAAQLAAPLISTSVNFSGTPAEGGTRPAFAFEHVLTMLASSDDSSAVTVAIDGGICPFVEATTIVDCSGSGSSVLERPGTIHVEAIRYVVSELDVSRCRRDMAGFSS
ncbi:L-threonylcarbamoyladenylate synthase [Bradyrhizobium yuanmingense]|uniref:L-threonylcarbamoyladenylate synthase n=1 Tax=Bradyrhizobium yuanmingense TaxID=108015 RepID=UPI0023B8EA7C|nr:Sua5/YciO/YrdC/YwlC family protein [Bradyrhizobium yuanmingense]MDF0492753.1 Sua5/YciO/YrdC/YwlC family protein [Bradyrhizobium yuanmingense]